MSQGYISVPNDYCFNKIFNNPKFIKNLEKLSKSMQESYEVVKENVGKVLQIFEFEEDREQEIFINNNYIKLR